MYIRIIMQCCALCMYMRRENGMTGRWAWEFTHRVYQVHSTCSVCLVLRWWERRSRRVLRGWSVCLHLYGLGEQVPLDDEGNDWEMEDDVVDNMEISEGWGLDGDFNWILEWVSWSNGDGKVSEISRGMLYIPVFCTLEFIICVMLEL